MTAQEINRRYLSMVNTEVDKVAQARRVYSPNYVDTVVLPQHERRMTQITKWREGQMLGSFSAFGQPRSAGPYSRQSQNPRVAELTQIMNAAIVAANDAYKQQTKAIQTRLNNIIKDANVRIKAAKQVKDKVTQSQLESLVKQARAAAQGEKQEANRVRQEAIATAKQNQQMAVSALLTPSGAPMVAAPTPASTITTTSPFAPQPMATPMTESYLPSSAPAVNVSVPTSITVPGAEPGVSADEQPIQEAATARLAPADDFSSPFDFSWLSDLFTSIFGPSDYTRAVPATTPSQQAQQAPTSVPDMRFVTPAQELDVFDIDPWTGGSSAFGNYVIKQLNRSPVVPARAVGFGQWTQLAGAVIQAGAQVGASALAPKPKAAAAPVIVQPQSSTSSWVLPVVLIGGAVLLIGGAVVVSRRR